MRQFEDSTIRRFVLGDLEEEIRAKVESEALANDDLFEQIEAIEDEIIEEFLSGKLPGSERKIFEETLDTIPGRRRRVELVKSLAARKPPSKSSNVVSFDARLRFASHARLAVAAGFAAAAITALIFVQARRSSIDSTLPAAPVASSTSAPAPAAAAAPTRGALPSVPAIAARKPLPPNVEQPAASLSATATSVVTLALVSGTARSGSDIETLDLPSKADAVDLMVTVDDDEFSHYHAELRAPDGSKVSSQRDLPVMAVGGAPVITIRVPASSLREGIHELVLAGVHERGAEEVAYIEFDVRRR